jgi:hypothetical protein
LRLDSGTRTFGSESFSRWFVGFAARDLLARQLAGHDRVHALDALRRFAVGDGLHLKRVQRAELAIWSKDSAVLSTSQTAVALGMSKGIGHRKYPLVRPRPWRGRWVKATNFGHIQHDLADVLAFLHALMRAPGFR